MLISAEYRQDIAAVAADPIARIMADEMPPGLTLSSVPQMLAASREFVRRGGVAGGTHIGAVAAGIESLRALAALSTDEVVDGFEGATSPDEQAPYRAELARRDPEAFA